MVGTLLWGDKCATSLCNLDLTFDFVVVTMCFKILSWLFFRFCKM